MGHPARVRVQANWKDEIIDALIAPFILGVFPEPQESVFPHLFDYPRIHVAVAVVHMRKIRQRGFILAVPVARNLDQGSGGRRGQRGGMHPGRRRFGEIRRLNGRVTR